MIDERPTSESIESRIEHVLKREIRPYIEMEGGKIECVEYADGIAYVEMQGACSACPSSIVTLKMTVEKILRKRIPEIQQVIPAGLDAAFVKRYFPGLK